MGITVLIVMNDIFAVDYVIGDINFICRVSNILCSIYFFSVLYFAKYILLLVLLALHMTNDVVFNKIDNMQVSV